MPDSPPPSIWLLSADIMTQLGGGLRQQRWCEYILARGEPVRLFQLSGAFGVQWVDVHSVEELRSKRKAWIAAAPPRAGVRDTRLARVARLFKHVFLLDLLYPSIYRMLAIMNGMMREADRPVTLLCSSPPFSMGVAGRIMKALHGERVVMALDMRDLWSLHTAFPGPKMQKRAVERWVIGGADIFTTVAPALASRFKARFGAEAEVVFNVATHAQPIATQSEPLDWSRLCPDLRQDSARIVYTGSIPAGFYDLEGFLDAVEHFARRPEASRLQFLFVGAGGELAVRAARRKLPTGLMIFAAQMAQDKAAEIQAAADALLFLGYQAADNQGQVSIKLFEYFRRRRPILPVHIRADSDVNSLVRLYCNDRCPELLTPDALAETFAQVASGNSGILPVATDPDAADGELLKAYERVADRIVGRYRAAD